jgi:hypothetical protein
MVPMFLLCRRNSIKIVLGHKKCMSLGTWLQHFEQQHMQQQVAQQQQLLLQQQQQQQGTESAPLEQQASAGVGLQNVADAYMLQL